MNKTLREKREEKKLTQTDISNKVNISVRAYQNYELGNRIPNSAIAIKLAEILNSTVEELFKSI